MANKKTSEENVLTKSGFNANTVMRLADGSTNDNYQIGCLDFINAITLTSAQAITLLGTPSDVVLDSMYKITTLGITGVDHVIISGRNMIQGNSAAECLVTGIGYVNCTYDVATNILQGEYVLWCADLEQSGETDPSIYKTHVNISGEQPTLAYISDGEYSITFTGGQLISIRACDNISGFIDSVENVFIGQATDSNTFILKTYASGAQANGVLSRNTIKITIQLKSS